MLRAPRFLSFLSVAVCLVGLLFSDALVSGRVLSQADILFEHLPWSAHRPAGFTRAGNSLLADVPQVFYPFLIHTADSLRAGKLPLWCASLFGGHPFLASFQSATFSPFTLPALALGPADALLASAVAKLLVGGVGMWLLLRRLGAPGPGRWFGATAYLLNPFSVVWAEHPVSAVSAWLPLLLWSTDRLVESRSRGDVALLAVTAGVVILAGHPETSYKILLFAAVYGLAGTWWHASTRGGSRLDTLKTTARILAGRFVPAAVLGVVLSAIQVVPFAEYLLQSQAWQLRYETPTNIYPAPAVTFIAATVVPNFFGNPSKGNYLVHYNRHGTASNYCEQQMYPGLVTWILAAVGLHARRRHWRARCLAAAAVAGGLLMFGVPWITDLFLLVPGAQVIVLTRFGLITLTAAIILGAWGVEALTRAPGDTNGRLPRWPPLAAAVTMLALTGGWLAGSSATLSAAGLWPQTLAWSAVSVLLVAAAAACVLARMGGRLGARPFGVLAVVLVTADLLALGWRYHPMVPRDQVFPAVPEIEFVKRDPGVFRVAGASSALLPNTAMAYGLRDLRGYDGVTPGLHADLVGTAHKGGAYRIVRRGDPFHVLDLMNVKYLFAPDGAELPPDRFTRVFVSGASAVYRNDRVIPRAYLVSRARVAGPREALRLIKAQQIDLRHEVLLPEPLAIAEQPSDGSGAEGEATIARYEDAIVEVETEAPARRLLVLGDLAYPGWTATLDGRPVPVLRANHALRAVAVPGGRHRVTFRFEPFSVRVGAWLTFAGAIVAAALAWTGRRDRMGGPPAGARAITPRPAGPSA